MKQNDSIGIYSYSFVIFVSVLTRIEVHEVVTEDGYLKNL